MCEDEEKCEIAFRNDDDHARAPGVQEGFIDPPLLVEKILRGR